VKRAVWEKGISADWCDPLRNKIHSKRKKVLKRKRDIIRGFRARTLSRKRAQAGPNHNGKGKMTYSNHALLLAGAGRGRVLLWVFPI